jgi:hypothetical protein
MLRRINWNQDLQEQQEDEEAAGMDAADGDQPGRKANYCHLVWQVRLALWGLSRGDPGAPEARSSWHCQLAGAGQATSGELLGGGGGA